MSSQRGACAACRYQRRRCAEDCLLARYFPQERMREFQNCHKLFTVRSMIKIIEGIEDQSQRDTAMQSLIIHANARAQDPVGGLYKVLCDLGRNVENSQAELNIINQQLAWYRQQKMQNQGLDLTLGNYVNLDDQHNLQQQSRNDAVMESPPGEFASGNYVVNLDDQNNLQQESRNDAVRESVSAEFASRNYVHHLDDQHNLQQQSRNDAVRESVSGEFASGNYVNYLNDQHNLQQDQEMRLQQRQREIQRRREQEMQNQGQDISLGNLDDQHNLQQESRNDAVQKSPSGKFASGNYVVNLDDQHNLQQESRNVAVRESVSGEFASGNYVNYLNDQHNLQQESRNDVVRESVSGEFASARLNYLNDQYNLQQDLEMRLQQRQRENQSQIDKAEYIKKL